MNKHFCLRDFFRNTSNFRIIFTIETMFFSIMILDVISIIANVITFIWGMYLVFKQCIVDKKMFKVKFFKIIALFIASNIITMFMQVEHNFWVNLAYIFYMFLVFFVFFGTPAFDNFSKVEKEILIVFKVTILINTVLVFISLLTIFMPEDMLSNLTYDFGIYKIFIPEDVLSNLNYEIGIYRGERLTGIYSNPNLLGFHSVVSIFMNLSLFRKKVRTTQKRIFPTWFSVFSITTCLIALFLSDSNASFLFLVIYITVLVFCKVFSTSVNLNFMKLVIRAFVLLIICMGLMMSYFVMRKSCQYIINETINDVKQSKDIDNQYSYTKKDDKNEDPRISFGRKVGSSNYKDVSSGRVDLIKQGVKIFKKHPIMGIGRGNLVYYGKLYLENGLRFEDLHNGYLTILVSSGIVGFLLFSVFGICVGHKLFSYLFRSEENKVSSVYYHILSAICGYCVYSLFEKTILTEMTFMVLFFWSMLGYAMSYALKTDSNKFLI